MTAVRLPIRKNSIKKFWDWFLELLDNDTLITGIEFVIRQALQQSEQSLQGLYDGNPKRKSDRSSAEQLLGAFCHITLYFLPDSTIFITPLNQLQKLLNLSS